MLYSRLMTRSTFLTVALLWTAPVSASMLVLSSDSGNGSSSAKWIAQGNSLGEDAMAADSVASYYTGKSPNQRLFVPVQDTTMPDSETIYSVQVRVYASSIFDLAGSLDGMKIAVSLAGVGYKDPSIDELSTSYTYYDHLWDVNPATLAPWTWADVNDLEAGVMTSKTGKPPEMTIFVDHIEVVVSYSGANVPPVAGNVTNTGIALVGETLTGGYTYSDADEDPEGISQFKWYRSDDLAGTNKVVISGATSDTYVLTAAEEGKYVYFEVMPVAESGVIIGMPVESPPIGPIDPLSGSPPTASNVSISGIDTVGEILTASYTYSDPDSDREDSSTFRWLRDSVEITGETGLTYTLTVADEGARIIFEVTPVAATGTPTTGIPVQSAPAGAIAPKPGSAPTAGDVSISGRDTVGEILTGSYTYNDTDGDTEGATSFRWLQQEPQH